MLPGWDKIIAWLTRHAPEAEIHSGPDLLCVEHAGDPAAEFSALTRSAGIILTPDLAPILIEGADAVEYLHRRLSQNIRGLALGHGAHALQLGGDGRLQSDLLVYRGQEALFVLAPVERADADATLIEKYTLNDDVQVDRFFATETMITLGGPAAPAVIAALIDPQSAAKDVRDTPWLGYFTIMLAGIPCRLFRDSRWPIPMFHLSVPPMGLDSLLTELREPLNAIDGRVCGMATLSAARMVAGPPRWGEALAEGLIPLEAGLYDAIDFNKGCYPGQEILARINNLGHPARSLVRWRAADAEAMTPGSVIHSGGEVIGDVCAAAPLVGTSEFAGMAYLKWDQREAASGQVEFADGSIALNFSPLGVTHG